jgi:hypothetical protein
MAARQPTNTPPIFKMRPEQNPVLVQTSEPYLVSARSRPLDGDPGSLAVTFFVNGQVIAHRRLTAEAYSTWSESRIFASPRHLGVLGLDLGCEIEVVIVLMLPPEAAAEMDLRQGVPMGRPKLRALSLGGARRPAAERRHPENFDAEMVDIRNQLFRLGGRTLSLEEQAVENLLASL